MTIHHQDELITLHHGDCLDVLRSLPDASVDSVVTDPPYGLEFMGKAWDSFKGDAWRNAAGITSTGYTDGGNRIARPAYGGGDSANPTCATCTGRKRGAKKCTCAEPDWRVKGKPLDASTSTAAQMRAFGQWCELWAVECLRVLKPGGHLLAFGGTRTWHRLACAVEDAGFEVRDSIAWLYGSGFPKSLDVSKAIDKAAGAERTEVIGTRGLARWKDGAPAGVAMKDDGGIRQNFDKVNTLHAPATDAAREWAGWGTALKPGHEPAVVARKPLQPCDILAGIGSQLDTLEQVWLALEVEPTTPTGAAGGSPAQTDTSPSESMAPTSSSTVSSWRACWAELCDLTSTSTTETTSSTTTALRTLSSSLWNLTHESTLPGATSPHGSTSLASAVDNLFASVVCGLRATLALSATEHATGSTPASPLDAAEANAAAFEPVVVARKPLVGTVAANVTTHGTGALNIDGCRIGWQSDADKEAGRPASKPGPSVGFEGRAFAMGDRSHNDPAATQHASGRWPANVILDEDMAGVLDEQSGTSKSPTTPVKQGGRKINGGRYNDSAAGEIREGEGVGYGDSGGASRFFFVAPADGPDGHVVIGKGGMIEPCETASTAAENSSPPRQFGVSAPSDAATSGRHDTALQMASRSTSETQSGSRRNESQGTPTLSTEGASSPEPKPVERTQTLSPASSAAPSAQTDTTTTTTSPSTSGGFAAPATSSTTPQWKVLGDTDSARFKYVAKAPKRERPVVDGVAHPTVKPLALMRWLVRLVTPPGGTVLEPFAGSGTTVEACMLEGFRCIAIEKGDEYLPLILARIDRRRDPAPELAEIVRTTDPDEAVLEQIDGRLDIFGEGVA